MRIVSDATRIANSVSLECAACTVGDNPDSVATTPTRSVVWRKPPPVKPFSSTLEASAVSRLPKSGKPFSNFNGNKPSVRDFPPVDHDTDPAKSSSNVCGNVFMTLMWKRDPKHKVPSPPVVPKPATRKWLLSTRKMKRSAPPTESESPMLPLKDQCPTVSEQSLMTLRILSPRKYPMYENGRKRENGILKKDHHNCCFHKLCSL
mmetsp:Transcript_11179/g.22887  ORF Transcript_11179/g.22887 Transcript_11179/m.22887 type:complete len:205 (+) Transcript_11179:551-1165(+)